MLDDLLKPMQHFRGGVRVNRKHGISKEGFEHVLHTYGESIIRLAFMYVGNKQTAEDIVQDVFLKAFEQQKAFRGESLYETYLYRMTINRCHDYFRSWSFKNLFLMNETFYYAENVSSAETKAMVNFETTVLWEELKTLPLKYREMLILHYYKELNVDKIVDILSVSPNTTLSKVGEVNG